MTRELALTLEPAPASSNVPEGTHMSVINFSILADTEELMNGVIDKLNEITNSFRLMSGIQVDAVPFKGGECKYWLNYACGVQAEHLVQTLNLLNDFGGNATLEAHERYGFPPGTMFYGPQAEVLYTGEAEQTQQEIENHNVSSYLLSTVYAQEVQNRALRKRIADLEVLTNEHAKQIQSLDEHLRGNTVMNFEYRGMHSVPSILWAIIEHIGADEIKRTFESMIADEYPSHHILH